MKMKYLIILAIVAFLGWILIKPYRTSDRTSEATLPPQFEDDRSAFVDSVIALNKARDLSQPPADFKGVTFDLSEDVESEMFSLTEKGINLGRKVSDDFLDYLHPELRVMYRQKLIKGAEMWLEGTKSSEQLSGVGKQISGSKLGKEWIDWFEVHGRSFEDKIF